MLNELRETGGAREFLERTVPAFRNRPHTIETIRVESVFPRPDWVIVYRISVLGGEKEDRTDRLLSVHRFPDAKVEKAAARIRRQASRLSRRDPLIGDFVAEKRDENLLIYPFPLDPKLTCLGEAVDLSTAQKILESELPCWADRGRMEIRDVRPVRYVPGRRCQLLYTLRFDDDRCRRVFGKVLRDDKGRGLYASMEKVARLFAKNANPDLTTPQPLAHIPRWGMVLQEEVPGVTLYELLRSGLADESHVRAAARSIAVLHDAQFQIERRHLLPQEREVVLKSYQRVQSLGCNLPAFGRVLQEIQDRFARQVISGAPVPVHGDFYDKQLLVDGARTALIDLDNLALGLRELDAANFLAHLRLGALQNKALERVVSRWEHAFVAEYNRRAASPLNLQLKRLFAAKTFFRLACLYSVRPNGAHLVPQLLRYAEGGDLQAEFRGLVAAESVPAGVAL